MSLDLLGLLLPSSSTIDNIVVSSVPCVSSPVVKGRNLNKDDLRAYREARQARRFRQQSASRSGSRGGRSTPAVSREDVLGALSGISDLDELFVYAFVGMLKEESLLLFEGEAYRFGLASDGLFSTVSFEAFQPVWRQAWRAYFDNQMVIGVKTLADRLGYSQSKAKRLMGVFSQSLQVILTLEANVGCRLSSQLRRDVA